MKKMVPGAWELNIDLQNLWGNMKGDSYSWNLPDNFHASIDTKVKEFDEFTFLNEKQFLPIKKTGRPNFHKGLGPNLIHSIDGMIVREMFRRCIYDKKTITRVINALDGKSTNGRSAEMVKTLWNAYQQSGFLSTRIFDYLYEDTMGLVDPMEIAKLLKQLPEQPFDLVSVHDCFRCHPNYGNDVRQQYNNIMADINDSNMLAYIVNQIAHTKVHIKKSGKIKREEILEGNYLLA